MRGAVLHAPGDVRLEARDDPIIVEPTDAIIRLSATCVCGSDLWPYRGIEAVQGPASMGHEYVGMVEEVGSAAQNLYVPPGGLEPPPLVPETSALSPELRGP
jgi:threonine dehydrogenase-like Zn-dependent dehydrogenase